MRPTLRLAHCSDIHLDSDYYGGSHNLAERDRYRAVFDRLLADLERAKPDLVLLAGDLFDSNRASTDTIEWAMARLSGLPVPLALIPGNHDCLAPDAIFRRHDFGRLPGVHTLLDPDGETRELPSLGVRLWGRGMIDHDAHNDPLRGAPPAHPELWNLGLAHGIHVPEGAECRNSSPIAAAAIAASGFDYLALGHHHGVRDASAGAVTAWYSGAPAGLFRQPGTWLLVELEAQHAPRVQVRELPD